MVLVEANILDGALAMAMPPVAPLRKLMHSLLAVGFNALKKYYLGSPGCVR